MFFDQVLENRLGHGVFQLKQLISLSFIDFIDGIESVFIGILLSIIKEEWSLSNTQVMLLGSSYTFGNFFGGLTYAYFADYIGRRVTLILASLTQIIVMFATSQTETFQSMFILRFIYGVLFGLTIPLSSTLLSETSPKDLRGRYLVYLHFFYQVGKIYLICLCFIFLEDYSHGEWRKLILINVIPSTLCFICSIVMLEESPRLYLVQHKFSEAFRIMNKIGTQNLGSKFKKISNKEVQQQIFFFIKKDSIVFSLYNDQELTSNFWDLFTKNYYLITIMLWSVFIIIYLQNNILYLILPFLFQSQGKGLEALLIAYTGETFGLLIAYLIIDEQKLGGRKGLMILSAVGLLTFQSLIFIVRSLWITTFVTLTKLQYRLIWPTQMAIANESYLTRQRALGVGWATSIAKAFSAFSPFIAFPLFHIDPFLPFLFLSFCALILLIVTLFYPINKTREFLEENSKQK